MMFMILVLIIMLLQLLIYYTFTSISLNVIPLKCVSVNNQEYKIRPEIININSSEPLFYPYSIKVNKCSGSCNNINDPYSKLCVPELLKT